MPQTLAERLFLAALGLAGAGAVLLSTSQYGAGLSPDAVGYIGVARQLLEGRGVLGYEGQPFVIQPPLFPALLALSGLAWGLDPLAAAPLVNALLTGAAIYLAARLCARHLQVFPAFASFGPALALCSWPFFAVGVMAWSEPLFICLALLFFLSLERQLEKGGWGWLGGMALWAGLACLTRYIGLTFLLAGSAALLIFGASPWRERLCRVLLFGAVASLPLVLWLGRNYVVSGTLLGPRFPASHSLFENLILAACGLSGLFVPETLVSGRLARLGLGGLAALGMGAGTLWMARTSRAQRQALKPLGPVGLWAGIYIFFLILSSTTTAYDDINLRLLSPLYAPLVLLVLAGAQGLGEGGWHKGAQAGLVLLLLLGLAGMVRAGMLYAGQGAGAGTGTDRYNTLRWRQSETLLYLQKQPLDGPLYSNAPDALYILNGMPARMSLRHGEEEWPASGQLIWLDAVRRKYLVSPEELQTQVRLRMLARLSDGAVYAISPKEE